MTTESVDIGLSPKTFGRGTSDCRCLELNGNHGLSRPENNNGSQKTSEKYETQGVMEEPTSGWNCSCTGNDNFTTLDILFTVGGMLVYIADLSTDLLVALTYLSEGDIRWSALTFVFVLVPSVALQYLSFKWSFMDLDNDPDHHRKSTLGRIWSWCQLSVIHVLQLGVIKRHCRRLLYGLRSRQDRHFYCLMVFEYRDITLLQLLEAFMESAPQLVLQVYIMTQQDDFHWLTAVSAVVSLSSLAWALEACHKAERDSSVTKGKITYLGVALRILWRLFTITSRVISLALFASVYRWWVFIVAAFHWLIVTAWLAWQKIRPNFKGTKRWLLYGCLGIVHIFCFFNMKQSPTRFRACTFYTLIFIEDSVLFALWFYRSSSRETVYGLPALIFVWGGFFVGLFFMVFYYRFCHPSGGIGFRVRKSDGGEEKPKSEPYFKAEAYINMGVDEADGIGNMGSDEMGGRRSRGVDEVDGRRSMGVEVDGSGSSTMSKVKHHPFAVSICSYKGRRAIDPGLLAKYTTSDKDVKQSNQGASQV